VANQKKFFPLLFKGAASEWFDSLDNGSKDTLANLKTAFEAKYKMSEIEQFQTMTDLWSRKQLPGESVDVYISETLKLARLAGVTDVKLQRYAISIGLHPEIRKHVLQTDPQTVPELIRSAKIAEQAEKSGRSRDFVVAVERMEEKIDELRKRPEERRSEERRPEERRPEERRSEERRPSMQRSFSQDGRPQQRNFSEERNTAREKQSFPERFSRQDNYGRPDHRTDFRRSPSPFVRPTPDQNRNSSLRQQQTYSRPGQQLNRGVRFANGNNWRAAEQSCYNCGFSNHTTGNCRFLNVVCYNCNLKGHIARRCPKNNGYSRRQ